MRILILFLAISTGIFAQTSASIVRSYTVATLPAASSMNGRAAQVTDALNSADCVTGGGALAITCYSNGSTWSARSITNNSQLTNGSGFTTTAQAAAAAPVQSVAGHTGTVALTHNDVSDWATATSGFGSGGAASWGSITGTLSNQTDLNSALSSKVTSAQAAAAAPVQSVAGRTGTVSLAHTDITDWATATSGFGTGGGAASWGGITGTLSSQTDLQTALNGKAPTGDVTTLKQASKVGSQNNPGLTTWNSALNNSGTAPVNVAVLGDSLSCCMGLTTYTNAWPMRMQTYLQGQYGARGSGTLPLIQGTNGDHTNGAPWWTITGTPVYPATGFGGPYQNSGNAPFGGAFGSLVEFQSGSGTQATTAASWQATSINIYFQNGTDTQPFPYSVDGGAETGTCGANAASTQFATCTITVPAGAHTLTISSPTTGNAYIYGAEFIQSTHGVAVHNLSHVGAESAAFTSDITKQLATLDWINANDGGVHLVVIELGANEFLDGTAIGTLTTNLQTLISHVEGYASKPSIVIWDFNYFVGQNDATQPNFHREIQNFAFSNNYPMVSLYNYWGTTGGQSGGYLYTDNAHLNDSGHAVAAQVAENLIANANAGFDVNGNLVGIAQNPNGMLGVDTGTATPTAHFEVSDSSLANNLTLNNFYWPQFKISTKSANMFATEAFDAPGAHEFEFLLGGPSAAMSNAFTLYDNTSGNMVMRWDNNDRVGIGIGNYSTAQSTLDVGGTTTTQNLTVYNPNALTQVILKANAANPTGGNTNMLLSVQNSSGTQTAFIRPDGTYGANTYDTADDATAALANGSGLDLASTSRVCWTSTTAWWDAQETCFGRSAANTLAVYQNGSSTLENLQVGKIQTFRTATTNANQMDFATGTAGNDTWSIGTPITDSGFLINYWNGTAATTALHASPAGVLTTNKNTLDDASGNATITGNLTNTKLRTGTASNADLAGKLTLASGTASYTFTGTYTSAPVCVATDTTAASAVRVTTTTTTLTVTGTSTDGVNYICVGRN